MVKDPVCGKVFDARDATVAARHRGRYCYFCSMSCKVAFELTPSVYLWPGFTRPPTRTTSRTRRAA